MIEKSAIVELRCDYCGLIHKLKITSRVDYSSIKELRILLPNVEVIEGSCMIISRIDEAIQ